MSECPLDKDEADEQLGYCDLPQVKCTRNSKLKMTEKAEM